LWFDSMKISCNCV